jgi:hypothetical protein
MQSVQHDLRHVSYDADAPRPLPRWAALMARLGAALAEVDPAQRRLIIGVTLPTRGYAASIAAAAHVLRCNQLDPIEPSDADLHFEILRALPDDTPIKLLQGGRLHDGRLLGTEWRDGHELLKVSTRRMTRYLPKQLALKVRLLESGRAASGDLRSRRIDVAPLLAGFVEGQQAAAFATQSRVDCVIAGTLTMTTADLTAPEFTTDSDPESRGCLQDLARVSGVAGASSGSRSVLVAAGASTEDLPAETPRIVVFDGGRAYVRLGHAWTSSHHLVVIDRSLPSAEPAAEALNFAYFERSGEDDLSASACPPSMELMSFEAFPA